MKIINRRFQREYEEIEKYEAGIALTGGEVKVIRQGGLKLDGSFVRIVNDEALLFNAEIPSYQFAKIENYDPRRTRKLLLHKKELERLKNKITSSGGLTIIPIACYNKGNLIKFEIALSRGRKDLEKKKLEKRKAVERQEKREAKEYLKS